MEKPQMKLLIDGGAKRVVFAEAGKELVDFLFRLTSLPIAVGAKCGSLGNVHGSIGNLSDYLLPEAKAALFKPPAEISPPPAKRFFYKCEECEEHCADDPRAVCPDCGIPITQEVPLVAVADGGDGGCVKGLVTYMVMDDLTITPLSVTAVLQNLHVKSVADLSEKVVYLGIDEAVKLLSASLLSKNVLTNVFLEDANTALG